MMIQVVFEGKIPSTQTESPQESRLSRSPPRNRVSKDPGIEKYYHPDSAAVWDYVQSIGARQTSRFNTKYMNAKCPMYIYIYIYTHILNKSAL